MANKDREARGRRREPRWAASFGSSSGARGVRPARPGIRKESMYSTVGWLRRPAHRLAPAHGIGSKSYLDGVGRAAGVEARRDCRSGRLAFRCSGSPAVPPRRELHARAVECRASRLGARPRRVSPADDREREVCLPFHIVARRGSPREPLHASLPSHHRCAAGPSAPRHPLRLSARGPQTVILAVDDRPPRGSPQGVES